MPFPTSALQKYAFINAKLRTRLSKILAPEVFSNLEHAHSLFDAMQILKNTPFSDLESIYAQTGDLKMVELELFRREILLHQEIEKYLTAEVKDFCYVLVSYYEIENLKRILRFWFDAVIRGRDVEDFVPYLYREPIHYNLQINEILTAHEYSEVIQALKATPYAALIQEALLDIQGQNSLFPLEIKLDRYYYQNLSQAMQALEPQDFKIAKRLVGIEIDLLNINWIIRFKVFYKLSLAEALQYLLPGGYQVTQQSIARAYDQDRVSEVFEELSRRHKGFTAILKDTASDSVSRLVLIERILEHILQQEVTRVLTGYPFSLGIILAYFILKKLELKKILTVLNAKQYGLKAEELSGRL